MTLPSDVHALILTCKVISLVLSSSLNLGGQLLPLAMLLYLNLSEQGKGLIFPGISLPGNSPLFLSKSLEVHRSWGKDHNLNPGKP